MSRIIYVNNTGADIRDFHDFITKAVLECSPLPEEIADIFNLEFVYVDGFARGIVTFA